MKINFIIPFTYNTGGLRVIFEYTNHLIERGHTVKIYQPIIPYLFREKKFDFKASYQWLKNLIKNIFFHKKNDWFELKAPIKKVWLINNQNIEAANIVVATAWPTAYSVSKLDETKGEKFYLIQHYEIFSGPKEKINQTWTIPSLNKIVIASWMQEFAKKQFDQKVCAMITNGINLKQFHNEKKEYHEPRRIGMLYSNWKWKGFNDGYQAYKIAKKKYPELKLYLLGISKEGAPEHHKFYENPAPDKIREFYNNCDIFISPSWKEGCHLPPMEAMACKCALVATNVGGVPDYTVNEETALVSEIKNPNNLAKNILRLLDDPEFLKQISEKGNTYIQQFTWDKATSELEAVFNEQCKNEST